MQDNRIQTVKGWQLTTQSVHTVKTDLFADCSGDAILAPLTGAACRIGREAAHEYRESIAAVAVKRRLLSAGDTTGNAASGHAKPAEQFAERWRSFA